MTLSRAYRALRRTRKKTLIAVEQARPDVIEARRQWAAEQLTLDAERIVFIDETWAKTNMTRTYGRSPRGSRLRAKGFVAPLCIQGAVSNSDVQQAVAGMAHYRCNACAVITNSRFTVSAEELALSNRCKLIGEEQIADLVLGRLAI